MEDQALVGMRSAFYVSIVQRKPRSNRPLKRDKLRKEMQHQRLEALENGNKKDKDETVTRKKGGKRREEKVPEFLVLHAKVAMESMESINQRKQIGIVWG